MPRKRKSAAEAAPVETTAATAVAEPETNAAQPTQVPDWVEGPSGIADAPAEGPTDPNAKNWGNPYKAIFVSREKGFEMGEHRRFKQRVFLFAEKPSDDVLTALKDNGFVYRAAEKVWTIPANPDTRKLTDEMAREIAGPAAGMSL